MIISTPTSRSPRSSPSSSCSPPSSSPSSTTGSRRRATCSKSRWRTCRRGCACSTATSGSSYAIAPTRTCTPSRPSRPRREPACVRSSRRAWRPGRAPPSPRNITTSRAPGPRLRSILDARVAAGQSPADAQEYIAKRLAEVSRPEPYYAVNHLRDGRVIAVMHQPKRDGGWVAIHQDITAQKRVEAEVAHMARHDSLTDLSNRTLFMEKIVEALARLRRGGETFSVFMIDVDRFKAINDSLGHPVGDALLKAINDSLGH